MHQNRLAAAVDRCPPSMFSLVMATGIVAIATGHAGLRGVDEPVRNHLPAAADAARGQLPRAHLHSAPGAALRPRLNVTFYQALSAILR